MLELQKEILRVTKLITTRQWPTKVIHASIPQPIDHKYSMIEEIPNFFRLYICIGGTDSVVVPTDSGIKVIEVKAGQAILVHPHCWIFAIRNKSHLHFNNFGISLQNNAVQFSENSDRGWPLRDLNFNYPIPSKSLNYQSIKNAFELLINPLLHDHEEITASIVRMTCFVAHRILEGIIDFNSLSKKQRNEVSLQALIYYIDHNFNRSLTRHELAVQFDLSDSTVAKYFKNQLHLTFRQYLTTKRMKYAGELLLDSNLTVSAISSAAGYSHNESFTFAFEKYFGSTPSIFRKAVQRDNIYGDDVAIDRFKSCNILPLLNLEELEQLGKTTSGNCAITVPFTNLTDVTVELYEVRPSGRHYLCAKAEENQLVYIKTSDNTIILVKDTNGEIIGGYQVLTQGSIAVLQ